MLEWMNLHIDDISLLWLLPILFMFHDFEEILTIEQWAAKHGNKVQASLPPFMSRVYQNSMRMNTLHFAADVLFVYLLIVAVTCISVFFSSMLLYLAVLGVFCLHVFTHLGQSVFLRMYTPGVVTAVLIALPYSIYAYYRLLSDGTIDAGDIGRSFILILLLAPPIVWGLLKSRARRHAQSKGNGS